MGGCLVHFRTTTVPVFDALLVIVAVYIHIVYKYIASFHFVGEDWLFPSSAHVAHGTIRRTWTLFSTGRSILLYNNRWIGEYLLTRSKG